MSVLNGRESHVVMGVDETRDHHMARTTDGIKSGIATRQVVVCPDRLDPSVRLQHSAVFDNDHLPVVARLAQDVPPANQRRIGPARPLAVAGPG